MLRFEKSLRNPSFAAPYDPAKTSTTLSGLCNPPQRLMTLPPSSPPQPCTTLHIPRAITHKRPVQSSPAESFVVYRTEPALSNLIQHRFTTLYTTTRPSNRPQPPHTPTPSTSLHNLLTPRVHRTPCPTNAFVRTVCFWCLNLLGTECGQLVNLVPDGVDCSCSDRIF